MGVQRWAGVVLSILGGYLVVTALSSPQQKPLAAWLGGQVPEAPPPPAQEKPAYEEAPMMVGAVQEPTHIPIIPASVRALFGIAGAVVLIGAFMLVMTCRSNCSQSGLSQHSLRLRAVRGADAMTLFFAFLIVVVITLIQMSLIYPLPFSDTGTVRYRTLPYMTYALIIVNALVFIVWLAPDYYRAQGADTLNMESCKTTSIKSDFSATGAFLCVRG